MGSTWTGSTWSRRPPLPTLCSQSRWCTQGRSWCPSLPWARHLCCLRCCHCQWRGWQRESGQESWSYSWSLLPPFATSNWSWSQLIGCYHLIIWSLCDDHHATTRDSAALDGYIWVLSDQLQQLPRTGTLTVREHLLLSSEFVSFPVLLVKQSKSFCSETFLRKGWWWAVSGFGSDCQLMWEPAPASSARSRGEEEEKRVSPMGFIMLILKSSANSHWLHCHMFVMTWFLYCGLLGPFGPYRQPVSLGGGQRS